MSEGHVATLMRTSMRHLYDTGTTTSGCILYLRNYHMPLSQFCETLVFMYYVNWEMKTLLSECLMYTYIKYDKKTV